MTSDDKDLLFLEPTMKELPWHAAKRIAAYYDMGGFNNKNLPVLVMNALDTLSAYVPSTADSHVRRTYGKNKRRVRF